MTSYDVHGVVMKVDAPSEIAAVVDSRLLPFRCADGGGPSVVLSWRRLTDNGESAGVQPPLGTGRPVYDRVGAEVLWWDDAETLWLNDPKVRAVCRPRAGTVEIDVLDDDGATRWLATHGVLTLALIEVLRRRQLFNIHAAAVATPQGSLLLAGNSGSGKTTLSLALARTGLPLLGDDTALLCATDHAVAVHAFTDEVDVTADTVHLLPWLAEHVSSDPPSGWPKWPLRPEKLLAGSPTPVTTPLALMFPIITSEKRSSMKPVDADTALAALLPNVLLTAADVVQAHVNVLARLVREVPAYRVESGRDPAEAAAVLREAVGLG